MGHLILVVDVPAAAALEGVLTAIAADAVHVRHEAAATGAVQYLQTLGPQIDVVCRELHLRGRCSRHAIHLDH